MASNALRDPEQEADQYANKAAHVELAARMMERDPATAPLVRWCRLTPGAYTRPLLSST